MKTKNFYIVPGITIILLSIGMSCTKLDQKVYSVVPDQNFWQTPEQIAAGLAPAYQALTALPNGNLFEMNEVSGGGMITPTRGNDWYDNGQHQALWLHSWDANDGQINGLWSDIFNGIGKANFTLSVVNSLPAPPADIDNINAELKVLRAYYYFWAIDCFGQVPYVTSFNIDPNTVTNSLSRAAIYDSIVNDINANINLLPDKSDATYGRMTRWGAHMLLAKLYLNAGVYTGTPNWAACIAECDSVINSGKYSLTGNYFDNFATNNEGSGENIFVVPFDKINIGGNNWEMQTLHYQSNLTYDLSGSPWNGYCVTADIYNAFDSMDTRRQMFLVGQQYGSDGAALTDIQTGLPLVFNKNVDQLSNPADYFRLAGARNVKYHPESGTAGNQSNDMVLFRLADAYVMRAEAEFRLGDPAAAAADINLVRERAFGDNLHDWTTADVTAANLYAERQREFSWECWSRQDAIRFGYFGSARYPAKPADADKHWELFPIPAPQISSNPNLKQNPGY